MQRAKRAFEPQAMLTGEFGLCNFSTIYIKATWLVIRLMARPAICHMNICLLSLVFVFGCYCVCHPGMLLSPLAAALVQCSSFWVSSSPVSLGCFSPQLQSPYSHTLGNFPSRARNQLLTGHRYYSSLDLWVRH